MKILMIAHLSGSLSLNDNDRFKYLANLLVNKGHTVELITSDFEHHKKNYRNPKDTEQFSFEVTLIHEMKYQKNVSIKRLFSHFIFSINLIKYLKSKKDYEVVYCSMPPLMSTYIAQRYSKKRNINFYIDIQDLWPEAFTIALKNSFISKMVLWPLKKLANTIYKNSQGVIAVSETYMKRASSIAKKDIKAIKVFLGTDLSNFDKYLLKDNSFNIGSFFEIVYLGNLGYSYDLESVIKAINQLNMKGYKDIRFVVIGDGPYKSTFEDLSRDLNINAVFTGKLDYNQLVPLIKKCDLAVNPIKKGAASIVNKVGDYASAGLAVINTQDSLEYRNMIDKYKIGLNCKNGDYYDISLKIEHLYKNRDLLLEYGRNNRALAVDFFDRNKTYNQIIDFITEDV